MADRRTHWRIQPSTTDLLMRLAFLLAMLAGLLAMHPERLPSINLDLTEAPAAVPAIDEGSRRRAFAAGDWQRADQP